MPLHQDMDEVALTLEPRYSRWLLVAVPLCAVFAAFGAIVWLSHPDGAPIGEPPLIEASSQPIKTTPEDPGGSTIADLGEVRELLSDQPVPEAPERLLPAPERPLTPVATSEANAAAPETDTTSASTNGQPIEAADLPVQNREQAALTALAAEAERLAELLTSPVAEAEPPATTAGADTTPSPAAPRALPTAETDSSASPPATAVVPASPSATAFVPALAATGAATRQAPVPGRLFRVQLAAVRAEADARRAWQLIQQDLGGVLSGLEPHFERAETDNGIFYRVQVGPFASADAADFLCSELKQRNASCFVVRR